MIKSVTTESYQNYDGLTLAADITVIGGSTRQIFNVGTQTYEDDRRLVPCILYADMAGRDPSNPESVIGLSGIEWYSDNPDNPDALIEDIRIVNPSSTILDDVDVIDPETGEVTHEAAWRAYDYLISDGVPTHQWCADVPVGALIVRKNIPARTSMSVYAVIKSVDPRFQSEIRITRFKNFTTEAFDDSSVKMEGSWGSQIVFDPFAVPEPTTQGGDALEEPWLRTVSVHMNGVDGVIPAAESCYQWLIGDENAPSGYRKFTELEKKVLGISDDTVADLTIDIRCIQGEMLLRCYGCRLADGDEWTDPTAELNPFYDTAVAVRYNETIRCAPVCRGGADQGYAMSRPSKWDMRYMYANKPVADGKRSFFRNNWKGQDIHTREKFSLGASPSLSFLPCDYNIGYGDGYTVGADVAVYGGHKPVTCDGKVVVDDQGRVVISATYE